MSSAVRIESAPPLTDQTPNRTVLNIHRQLENQFQPAAKHIADSGTKLLKAMNAMDTALREYTTHLHQLGMSANGATREAQESGEDLKKLAGALQVFNDKHKSNIQLFNEIVTRTNSLSQTEKDKLKEMRNSYSRQEKELIKQVQKNYKTHVELEQFYASQMRSTIGNQNSRYKFFVDKHVAWMGAYVELCKQMGPVIPLQKQTDTTTNTNNHDQGNDQRQLANGDVVGSARSERSSTSTSEISVESLPHSLPQQRHVHETVLNNGVELVVHQPRTHSFAESQHNNTTEQHRQSQMDIRQPQTMQQREPPSYQQQQGATENAITRMTYFTPPEATTISPNNNPPHQPVALLPPTNTFRQQPPPVQPKPVASPVTGDQSFPTPQRPPIQPKPYYNPPQVPLRDDFLPPMENPMPPPPVVPIAPTNPKDYGKRLIATYDYKATADNQLTLNKGDHLILLKKGVNGWQFGKLATTHHTGWFPASHVALAEDQQNVNEQRRM